MNRCPTEGRRLITPWNVFLWAFFASPFLWYILKIYIVLLYPLSFSLFCFYSLQWEDWCYSLIHPSHTWKIFSCDFLDELSPSLSPMHKIFGGKYFCLILGQACSVKRHGEDKTYKSANKSYPLFGLILFHLKPGKEGSPSAPRQLLYITKR